ncbi:sulfurtransferase [Streptococcus iniae]|uniref:Sulfurtransferase n=2 Tax=Streptococcus iniae TaxID=1346 RepID=A0ABM5QK28_STRIN|nr:sulfurtransferase [Streptococcus iniae]AHY18313.1 sulfurtransferase [Streptococcus iniae]
MTLMQWFQKQESISTQELEKLIKEGNVKLIDVRTKQEFQNTHIKGAQNIPLTSISQYKGNKKQIHYVICQSGIRSKKACQMLTKAGYSTINVKGGMSSWDGSKV